MKKNFWKKVLIIGLPVAIQNLINTLLNMVDTLMISSLGENSVSAVGLANKVFFVFMLLTFGIVSGSQILASQYYGKEDGKGINRCFSFSAMLSFAGSLIFFIPAFLFPEFIMSLFTDSESLVQIGAPYLQIVSVSYMFTAISMSITSILKAINKTRAPMFVTMICVVINAIINAILIFGLFGTPKLGVVGAAYGTVVARTVELVILFVYFLTTKKTFKLNIKDMISLDKEFIVRNIKISTPVIINEFGWGLGTTIYSVIYGHMGDDVIACMTISQIMQDLVFVFLLGVSNAAAILIGNELGANKFEEAKVTASKLLKANVLLALGLIVILLSTMGLYIQIYTNVSDTVKQYFYGVCIVYGLYLPFKAFNLTNICGVLRSGGDTVFCMLLDVCAVWLIGIPCGLLSAFVFKWSIPFVFGFILMEEVIKIFIGYHRYKKNIWVKNIIHN